MKKQLAGVNHNQMQKYLSISRWVIALFSLALAITLFSLFEGLQYQHARTVRFKRRS